MHEKEIHLSVCNYIAPLTSFWRSATSNSFERVVNGRIRGQNGRLISHDRTRDPRLMKVIKFFCISKSPPPRAWWMFYPISYESGSTAVGEKESNGDKIEAVEGEWKISPFEREREVFASFPRHRSFSSPRATIWLPSQMRCIDAPVTLLRELIWFITDTGHARERYENFLREIVDWEEVKTHLEGCNSFMAVRIYLCTKDINLRKKVLF